MSLLKQNRTRKKRVNKFLKWELKLNAGKDKEYKVETIKLSIICNKVIEGKLPRLYYLVSWKNNSKDENTWKIALAIMHLQKMTNIFYKDYLEKSIATSLPLNSTILMARPKVNPKQKHGKNKFAKSTKWAKKAKLVGVESLRSHSSIQHIWLLLGIEQSFEVHVQK